jgi:hypothetical protein
MATGISSEFAEQCRTRAYSKSITNCVGNWQSTGTAYCQHTPSLPPPKGHPRHCDSAAAGDMDVRYVSGSSSYMFQGRLLFRRTQCYMSRSSTNISQGRLLFRRSAVCPVAAATCPRAGCCRARCRRAPRGPCHPATQLPAQMAASRESDHCEWHGTKYKAKLPFCWRPAGWTSRDFRVAWPRSPLCKPAPTKRGVLMPNLLPAAVVW